MFLKILEYSQENTCIGVKVAGRKTCNFIEKETPTEVFSYEYWEIFKSSFSVEYFRWLLLV